MSKRNTPNEQVLAMRAANHRLYAEALADGRKQRSTTIPSAKAYKRSSGKRVDW